MAEGRINTEDDPAYDDVAPDPSAMIESMRAYGYTLATAVSDLIDNSIVANGRTVWIDSHWAGEQSWLTVSDDGEGMSGPELSAAMRLGSRSPLEDRAPTDLGRFGLGMKTASLSQCRRLTVVSKKSGGAKEIRRWDLDHLALPEVVGWQLLRSPHPGSTARTDRIDDLSSGTTVVWEVLDRLAPNADRDDRGMKSYFLKAVDELELYLGMVFHRYLEGPRRRLRIFVDDNEVKAWDPYGASHVATKPTPEEPIDIPGHPDPVRVKGFVLPHKDMLGPEAHRALAGPKGWNAQQGFYLYRNERLIVAGSWLGLGGSRPWTQEEHYKLARIRVDVPNSMDHAWQLDVKKSTATPPPMVRSRLQGLAQDVRQTARGVFAHRGSYGKRPRRTEHTRPWKVRTRSDSRVYAIDRKHPMVDAVVSALEPWLRPPMEAMLRIIEETVPIEQIWLDTAEFSDQTAAPFYGLPSRDRADIIRTVYSTIRRVRSLGHEEAIEVLKSCQEFDDDESSAILEVLAAGESQ